ncbi:hypothetical protein CEP54_008816 [Fusarium duplospermum]|uniref:Uncharacterized protein n=1 Tax=Fusarium duplospermum TaxID=1325734 RepID=A0A428PTT8_9HYPO|nr:hypothetical protein CEP54_008816 [Fusarium duplospermum]
MDAKVFSDPNTSRWSAFTVGAHYPGTLQGTGAAPQGPRRCDGLWAKKLKAPFASLGALPAGPKDCFDGDNGLQSPAKQALLDALQHRLQCRITAPHPDGPSITFPTSSCTQ